MDDMQEVTAPQAAEILGKEKRYLTDWAKRGEVAGARLEARPGILGLTWVATLGAWRAAATKERHRGRPPKEKPQETP